MDIRASASRNAGALVAGAADRDLLRFLTCGSVDDGKSTLIGRLLSDANHVFDDHLQSLQRDSRRYGTTGEDVDYALLVDGLESEREQGITIDVAYRYFSSKRRSFIVVDAPGHEQYTRNMATGASAVDLAIILVDARKGLLVQTHRHSCICSMFGIRNVVLAINKIDLIGFDQSIFTRIVDDFSKFAKKLEFRSVVPIPISARFGDNVATRSANLPWYSGPTLLEYLEEVDIHGDRASLPFRFPVQWINRPDADFRGFSGTVSSGVVRRGDSIAVAPSGAVSKVERIVTADADLEEAVAGDAVTLTLADEVDIARGDVIAPAQQLPQVSDQLAAHILWMSETPMLPGRFYSMRIGARWTSVSVTAIKHKIDVNTLEHIAARELKLNEIAFCNLSVSNPVVFDTFSENSEAGAFIMVDRYSNQTLASGIIAFGLRRADNIHWESLLVAKSTRAGLKRQKPCIVWFTGLSGSGKSTIAKLVEQKLCADGLHTYMLDGDNVRHGLNRDLGFTFADRVENIRRIAEVSKLMVDAGLIVLCAFISPFNAERKMVREIVEKGEFIEVFVDASLEECMRRDPKGLYAKANAGLIQNFTGISSPYEPPEAPELHLVTTRASAEALAEKVVMHLRAAGHLA